MKLLICILLFAVSHHVYADTDLQRNKVNNFTCELEGRKVYKTTADQKTEKCTLLPEMEPLFVALSADGSRATYLQTETIKRKDHRVEVELLLLRPDSGKDANFDGTNIAEFDLRTHKIYFCDTQMQTSDNVALFRNYRFKPVFIKNFYKADKAPAAVSTAPSIDKSVFEYLCNKGIGP